MSERIVQAIAIAAEVTGAAFSDNALRVYVRALSRYSEDSVLQAIEACMTDLKHRITLADILERMPGRPPGQEQAWAMALNTRVWEEGATVVIERAIFEAFPFSVWPDKVAARMVFKERYPETVRTYGGEMSVSLGMNSQERDSVVLEAVASGRITRERALKVLPHLAAGDGMLLGLDGLKHLVLEH